jgi:hypothetical protein
MAYQSYGRKQPIFFFMLYNFHSPDFMFMLDGFFRSVKSRFHSTAEAHVDKFVK